MSSESSNESFEIGQRVHSLNDPRRVGTVKYVGCVEGYSGTWISVDWDLDGDGTHDGSINGIFYFNGRSQTSASFVRSQNLSRSITFLQALEFRYRTTSTKDEEADLKKQSTCMVKTTSPKKYCVRPNVGVVEPKCEFSVLQSGRQTHRGEQTESSTRRVLASISDT